MGSARSRWVAAVGSLAALLLAVLTIAPLARPPAAAGPAHGVAMSAATTAVDVALAQPPTNAAQLFAQPVKRLPWSPTEPVRWSALLLVLLTTLAFGAVTVARRAWRWCPFVWRAPPVSGIA